MDNHDPDSPYLHKCVWVESRSNLENHPSRASACGHHKDDHEELLYVKQNDLRALDSHLLSQKPCIQTQKVFWFSLSQCIQLLMHAKIKACLDLLDAETKSWTLSLRLSLNAHQYLDLP